MPSVAAPAVAPEAVATTMAAAPGKAATLSGSRDGQHGDHQQREQQYRADLSHGLHGEPSAPRAD
jgi:hypothetical protein